MTEAMNVEAYDLAVAKCEFDIVFVRLILRVALAKDLGIQPGEVCGSLRLCQW